VKEAVSHQPSAVSAATPCFSCCGPDAPVPADDDVYQSMILAHLAELTGNGEPADALQLAALRFTQRQIAAWSDTALEAARAQLEK